MRRLRTLWLHCVVVAFANASLGHALAQLHAQPHASIGLTYTAPNECPNESVFRELVGARLGYVPFGPPSSGSAQPIEVQIQVCPSGECVGYRASLQLPQSRTLQDENCSALASAIALTVAIAVDPEAAMQATGSPTAPSAASGQASYGAPTPRYDAVGSGGLVWPSGTPTLPMPTATARRRVRVRFVTDTPGVHINLGGVAPASFRSSDWYGSLCVAPCEADVPMGSNYVGLSLGGAMHAVARPIRVLGGEVVRVRLEEHGSVRTPVSSAATVSFIAAAVLLSFGGLALFTDASWLQGTAPYFLAGGGVSLVLGIAFSIWLGDLQDVVSARVEPQPPSTESASSVRMAM